MAARIKYSEGWNDVLGLHICFEYPTHFEIIQHRPRFSDMLADAIREMVK